MVCTRVPHENSPGRRVTKVWQVTATTNAIIDLADHLVCVGIERVVVESTSDYWRPFFYLLEARGVRVWLVNARDVKNVPGRPKTDKLDAIWLAKLNERGMLRPSFVPPVQIRHLRDYTRLRLDLTTERSRHAQRLEKLLEDALIKISTVATDIMGVSGRAMIEALIAGQRDPHALADLAKGRMRVKHDALVQALTGQFDHHHGELAQILLDQVDALSAQIDHLTARIDQLIAAIPAAQGVDADGTTGPHAGTGPDAAVLPAIARLDEVPGIGARAAQIIIAEIGLDMNQFPTAGHLASWAKLCPRANQSGAKNRSGATKQGQPLPQGRPGRSRRSSGQDQHLPRSPLPPPGQTVWQAQGPGGRGPIHPGHHLAPAIRPGVPLPRSRPGLLRQPPRPRTDQTQPHPPARSPRLQGHPRARRLTSIPAPINNIHTHHRVPSGAQARPLTL